MGKITVNLVQLKETIEHLQTAEETTRSYADTLKEENLNILSEIQGGCTGRVQDAYTSINKKGDELQKEMADRLGGFTNELMEFEELVREADCKVKRKIEDYAVGYEKTYNIESGFFESMWNGICNGVNSFLNQTELGQLIRGGLQRMSDWANNAWEEVKEWYALEGGKYLVNIAKGIASAAAALFVIMTAGPAILAVIAAIAAAIDLINSVVKISSNMKAYCNYNSDPAWAYRKGENQKLSTLLEDKFSGDTKLDKFMRGFGHGIDCVKNVCDVLTLTDTTTKFASRFTGKETMFQKYLGSGGRIDSFLISEKNAVSEGSTFRVFDAKIGRWKKLNESGQEALDESGRVKTLNFSYKSNEIKGLGHSLKGLKNTYQTSNGELKKGSQILKEMFKSDVKEWKISAGREINRIKTMSFQQRVGGLKTLTKNAAENYLEGSVNLKNITKSIGQNLSKDLGTNNFSKNQIRLKAYLETTEKTWKRTIAKTAYVGAQINNGVKTVENSLKLLSGNLTEFSQTTKKLNEILKHIKILPEDFHIGKETTTYENLDYLLN